MRWDENYRNQDVINDPTIIPAYGVTDEERAYWNAKQEALEYDDYPRQYGEKILMSGVVWQALEDYKIQAIASSQAYFNGQVSGLVEAIERCETAATNAGISETNAAASETSASASALAASASETNAAGYEASASASKTDAAYSANAAQGSAYDAEAWAVGTRNGTPVSSSDPTYHNNSEYYASLGYNVIDDTESTAYTTYSSNKIDTELAEKADLVNGKIPAAQLPSYVDDIINGYYDSSVNKFYEDAGYTIEITGESDKIYVSLDTNKIYRWTGSGYVVVSETLALGETSSTAYAGDKGKANADNITAIQSKIPSGASSANKLATVADIPTALSELTDDATHRTVTDTEKDNWDSKADGVHNHDDRYYTESEVDTALSGKSNTGHDHDDRYYTETEIDTKFNGVTFTTSAGGYKYINW